MKVLIISLIIGLILGLTLVTFDGWKTLPDNTDKGVREVVVGGMGDREKGEQVISFSDWGSNQPVQIIFKLGLLMTGLGLGVGVGSIFEVENENNYT